MPRESSRSLRRHTFSAAPQHKRRPLFAAIHALLHGPETANRVRSTLALAGLAAFAGETQAAAVFPPEFDLQVLLAANGGDGSLGFAIHGVDTDAGIILPANAIQIGVWALSGGGDVNGDGLPDLAIGVDSTAVSDPDDILAGSAFIVFGREDPPAEIELSHLLAAQGGDGSEGLVINGTIGGYYSAQLVGSAVSIAGDVDGDGFDDVVIGAPWFDYDRREPGEAYVVFGTDQGFPAEVDFGDSAIGLHIDASCTKGKVGASVSRAGDFDGDDIDDFVIGGPGDQPVQADDKPGAVLLVFGTPGRWPLDFNPCSLANGDGSGGAVLIGIDPDPPDGDEYDGGDDAGMSVRGGGDLNGDGLDDVVIGAPGAQPRGLSHAGQAYIFFGRESGLLGTEYLEDLLPANGGDGSKGVILEGVGAEDRTGAAVAMMGDFNGDALADVAIGAYNADLPNPVGGAVYVVFGRSSGFPPVIELSTLLPENGGDGSAGVVFHDPDSSSPHFGRYLDAAGDINRDGLDDLIIDGGAGTFVIYGSADSFPAAFDLRALRPENGGDGTRGFVLTDTGIPGLGRAGDLNADGIDDLIISSDAGSDDPGIAYVLFGRDVPLDTDGDGVADQDDNCSQLANPDQRDTDGDNIGNLCDADLNNDCVVNFVDLAVMKAAFFTPYAHADLDGSGQVNFADLGLLKGGFFLPPGPSGREDLCDQ